ncbi:signal peptidase I [uncultured Clostridium sp.]|uniref:signal peptidase I n=1 Tax=uncultured Clostridium sp. TaxID=59620 RepID=UPI0025EC5B96|nr:signal peptidase I [uncultured Clostridium sp.]
MQENKSLIHDETNLESKENLKNTNKSSFFKEWILPVIFSIGIVFLLNKFVFINVSLPPSGSMIPTLNDNDRLIATRVWDKDKIKRGDILVFKSEELGGKLLIKRVIGLPGDHIEIDNGIVSINGKELNEEYVKNDELYNGIFDVPDNSIFFLGDNRAGSYDSRYWENPYIDKSEIEGKAQIRYYPISDFKIIK